MYSNCVNLYEHYPFLILFLYIAIVYFYIILHDLKWVNFEFSWLDCGTFSIVQALMPVLLL